MRLAATTAITLSLGVCLTLAAIEISPAAPPHAKNGTGSTAMIAQGQALVPAKRCNSCHGGDLNGKTGFSPSLHTNGVMTKYNAKTFARLMAAGVGYNNKPVKPQMPTYKMKAAESAPLYAYLKTLK